MKKLLLLAFLGIVTITSCNDDKTGETGPLDNQMEFDGTRYKIGNVTETYYGNRYGNAIDNFELEFTMSGDADLVLEIIMDGGERLPAGTYAITGSGIEAGGIYRASLKIGSTVYKIETGTLTISVSGSYGITLQAKSSAGEPLQLAYNGAVYYVNEVQVTPPLEDEFEFDGKRYPITGVTEIYYGDLSGDGLGSFDLEFSSTDDNLIKLSLTGGDRPRLVTGFYSSGENGFAGAITYGAITIGDTDYMLTSADLRLIAGDNRNSYAGEAVTADGKTVEFSFTGEVTYMDESPMVLHNQVMIGEDVYEIDEITQIYHGFELTEEAINIDLVITFGGSYPSVTELLIPADNDRILEGEYRQDFSYNAFTLGEAHFFQFGMIEITRFSVSVDEGLYSLLIEGETQGGLPFKCVYEGEIELIYQAAIPSGTGTLTYMDEEFVLKYCEFDYRGPQEDGWPANAALTFFNSQKSAEFYFDMNFPIGEFAGDYIYEEWDDGEIGPDFYTIEWGEGSYNDEEGDDSFDFSLEDGEMSVTVEGDTYTITGTFTTDEDEELEIYYKGKIYGIEEMQVSRASTGKPGRYKR